MSSKKKKDAPLPASSAGLMRFFEDETQTGVKVRPEIVIALSLSLILVSILLRVFLKI
ncbi:MAG: preprotein translocase subunit Sec61beta [Thaumarchaeota archaeon]|nr:preprotein translocase subunit Sec61beta [Nitrososphaerota archaeon]